MDFLFDIGNVIIDVDFIPPLSKLIPEDTDNPEDRLRQLLEKKDAFEAGKIPPDEYFAWAAETIGFTGPMEKFHTAWLDIFSPNKPMWNCIEQLASDGHRLILFSNINNPHKEYLLEHYPVFKAFTGGVFSYQTGHIKPEPEIYQIAIRQYSLTPSSTLYIDDLPANIEAGKQAGFRCHQYDVQRHSKFIQWLDQLL